MTSGWICKICFEKQYLPDAIINSESYTCPLCGSNEFQYEHNGIKHEAGNKRKILCASQGQEEKEEEYA